MRKKIPKYQGIKTFYFDLALPMAHVPRSQGSVLVLASGQPEPPFAGAGSVHVLENGVVPGPQVVEQDPVDSQAVHSPSVMNGER